MALAAETFGTYHPEDVKIPVGALLRLQGYRRPEQVRPRVMAAAVAAAERARDLLQPEVIYRRVAIEARAAGLLTLETGTRFRSDRCVKVLADCQEVVVFVLTLGQALDDAGCALERGEDVLAPLFLEVAGWLGVEKATRSFAGHLLRSLDPGAGRLTPRQGPGYADWRLEEQKDLFDLFAGVALPVRLQESCAMAPKKSRSGLYGIIPSR